MRKYWFTVFLCFTIVIIVAVNSFAGWLLPGNESAAADGAGVSDISQVETVAAAESLKAAALDGKAGGGANGNESQGTGQAGEGQAQGTGQAGEGQAQGTDAASTASGTDGQAASDGDQSAAAESESGTDQSQSTDAQEDRNFAGALFIGDSRTVGLSEYGNLGEAKVFANTGMSVYNVFKTEVNFAGEGKKSLEDVLSQGSYNTIYLMLGINELGYDFGRTVAKYQDLVSELKVKEPDAVIVLEANLHVTQDKATRNPVYANSKIDAFNQAVAEIAKKNGCYYLDVNVLFDDATGNMGAQYSTDGVHILGKYYTAWSDWLRKNQPPLPEK